MSKDVGTFKHKVQVWFDARPVLTAFLTTALAIACVIGAVMLVYALVT